MTTDIGIRLGIEGTQQVGAGFRTVTADMDKMQVSAKQTAAALRGVPAQFTDIITSLQGGQAPLTVFLQQGGQLKDMFGGAGPAAKALGGYIAGLVNPLTLAAGAVGVLGVAYYQGSKEADAYAKSIALTGNAAGATVGDLQRMAREVSMVMGTQGQAADVLAQLVGTGKVASSSLKDFAATAIAMERSVGISVEATVKQFAELGASPVEASKKLNETTNYLTASVYEQIKALNEQGRTLEAAGLAQKTYDQAMKVVATGLEERLGYVQRAWLAVAGAAKSGWDAMLNVGRPSTSADALDELRTRLTNQQSELAARRVSNPNADTSGMEKGIEILKQRVGLLASDERMLRRGAAAQAERVQAEKDAITAGDALAATQERGLTPLEKTNKELEKYRRNVAAVKLVNPTSEQVTPEAIARGEKAIRDAGAKSGAGAINDSLNAQLQAYKDTDKKILDERKAFFDQLAAQAKQGSIGELDVIDQSLAKEEEAWKAREANFKKELAAAAQKKNSLAEQERITGQLAAAEREYQKNVAKLAVESEMVSKRALDVMDARAKKAQQATTAAQEQLRAAQLEGQAIGLVGQALGELTLKRVEDAARQLEAQAIVEDGLEQNSRVAASLREQARLMRETFTQQGRNDAARIVTEYGRSVTESTQALQFELSVMGLTERQRNVAIEQQRIEIGLIKQRQAIEAATVSDPDERKRRLGELEAIGIKDKANAEDRVFLAEWQKTVNQYDDIFRQGFADMLNNGKDGWDSFTKSLATTFKTTVADAIYKQFAQPLVISLAGNMMGMGGSNSPLSALGGGGGSALGGIGNMFSAASAGYDLYAGQGVLAQAWGGIQGALGIGQTAQAASMANLAATPWAGSAMSSQAAVSAGAGGLSTMAVGGIVTAVMLGVINMLGGMRSESMVGSGFAGTLGNGSKLTPWQEWREGGTLIDGSSFATHNPLEELSSRRSELQRLRDAGQGDSNYAVGIQAVVTDLEKTTKGLAEQTAVFDREITKGYTLYRDNVVDMANSLGLAGSSIEDFAYTLGAQDLNLQGLNPEQIQAKITETFGKAGADMAQQLIGSFKEVTDTVVNTYVTEQMTQASDGAFVTDTTVTKRMEYQASVYAKTGETAIDTLTRLATNFNTLNSASDALGFGLHEGSLSLAAFADDFIEKFGGLEKFVASSGSFLQNYYTGEERRQALLRSGAQKAESLGFKGVTAEGLEQLGRSGVRDLANSFKGDPALYRDAMDLANFISPAFESIDAQVPVVQELSTAVDELTQAYQNAVKSLTNERDNLAVGLLRAQGDETGAKSLERSQYLAQFDGLDAVRLQEITTLYDTNEATRTLIASLEKQAETARTLADELSGLLDSWRSPAERITAGYGTVATGLAKVGINVAPDALAQASIDDIGGAAAAIYDLGTTSDETRLALVRAVGGLKSLKDQAVDLAGARVDAANAAFQREAQDRRSDLQETIADIRTVFDATSDAARSLLRDVDSTSAMLGQQGRAFIGNALDMARATGTLPDSKKLSDAISAATGDVGKAVYATQFEADRDRLVLGNKLSALGDIAGDQLDTQELELKRLDDMVKASQAQLDALNGIDTRVLGLDARFVQLSAAILGLQGAKAAATPGASAPITGAGGASFNTSTGTGIRAGDGVAWNINDIRAAGEAALLAGQSSVVRDELAKSGFSMDQWDKILGQGAGTTKGWLEDMGLQPFARGINLLPHDMNARVHKGEAIIPAQFNPWNPGASQPMGGGDGAVVAALERVEARLARIEASSAGTATNTAPLPQLGREFNQVTNGGNVMRNKAIA